jgi:sterol desaturase/sphingolipid hydroxylase (fatty acid hydroxylase superfamily)
MKTETPDEESFGFYDEKGHWRPPYAAEFDPVFAWPFRPWLFFKYLFRWGGLLFPWNTLFVALALVSLAWFQPSLAETKTLQFGWIGFLLVRNFVILWGLYGGLHLIFYTLKLHGKKHKYHPSFHQEKNKRFLFSNQVFDNVFRSNVFSLTLWTAYEVLYWWAAGNGMVPVMTFQSNPVWYVLFFFVILFWRVLHFYLIHRLIHTKFLFRHVHSVHHMNPNPGPWSGLSMHPIESLLYFSELLIHFVVPSSPVHFVFNSLHVALVPALGHVGFEGPTFQGALPIGEYHHYLHHKHVSCNFGAPLVPLDKWYGRYFNGIGEYRTKQNKEINKEKS